MKIAQIAPLYEAVPPRLYGGTERVVAWLAQALVRLGHEVTLFASSDSVAPVRLVGMRRQALRLDAAPLKSELASHLVLLDEVRRRAGEFDVLHFHTDMLHFPLFDDLAGRTLTTVHGRLDIPDLPAVYRRWHAFPLASISDRQRAPLPDAHWHGTVHHGIDPAPLPLQRRPTGGYLAFLGRASPEKGLERAIATATSAGLALRIAAKVDPVDQPYFERCVRPLLQHPLVEFIGEIGDADKAAFLGQACGLLFPVAWPEPFGLVMLEAMACGTPVIGWRRGAVPEVLEDGVSGCIVDDDSQAVAAVRRALRLDRSRVRAAFDRRFTAGAMAQAYVALYRTLPAFARQAGGRGTPATAGASWDGR